MKPLRFLMILARETWMEIRERGRDRQDPWTPEKVRDAVRRSLRAREG